MPLSQSKLRFKRATPPLDPTTNDLVTRKEASRPLTASSDVLPTEADTIMVTKPAPNGQLPTPDDSATDASSQSSQTPEAVETLKNEVQRVVRVEDLNEDEVRLTEAAKKLESSRNVSGQTLVSSRSESSLLRSSINALDMDWALSRTDLALDDGGIQSVDSLDTINVVTDGIPAEPKKSLAKVRRERAERERQERHKASEEKATRRSSRVTLLVEKAGSVAADLAASASALGKRSHNAMERSKGKLGSLKRDDTSRSGSEESANKKRKVDHSTSGNPVDPQVTVTKPYKAKKYLASGLYAGQPRTFAANLNGKANKRKSTTAATSTLSPPPKENTVLPLPMFACERLWNMGADFKLPFDVFSPLPHGRPKPDEWRKMNKNTFVGDAAAYWRGNDQRLKQFRSLCGCSEATGCDDDCQNRIMFYECNESNCSLGKKNCGNRSFVDLKERSKRGGKYQIGVEVIKTADRGYGVRSNRTFRPNQIIVEYTGEIITQEECEHRMRTTYKNNPHYYLMLFDSALVIDATVRGSISRFVNHACEPNCRMEKWTVNGKPRMALFANGDRGIMTGEELTYDYNFDPFCSRNVQECRCGSAGCRGILGKRAPGEKKNMADKKEEGKAAKGGKDKKGGVLAGAKRKLQSVLDESTSALNLAKAKKQKTACTTPPSLKNTNVKKPASSKRSAATPGRRSVSFASTTTNARTSAGRVVKPRNSPGPKRTPAASRTVSFASATKSTSKSTPRASNAGKKIKARVQTPGTKGSKTSGASLAGLKGLLGRSGSRKSVAAAAAPAA